MAINPETANNPMIKKIMYNIFNCNILYFYKIIVIITWNNIISDRFS